MVMYTRKCSVIYSGCDHEVIIQDECQICALEAKNWHIQELRKSVRRIHDLIKSSRYQAADAECVAALEVRSE